MGGEINLISPFPKERLWDAYQWHTYVPTCINTQDIPPRDWIEIFSTMEGQKYARTVGVEWRGELVGLLAIEPIYRHGQPIDANIHGCFSRKGWGKGIMEKVGPGLVQESFSLNPHLLRISAYTPSTYRPSHRVMEELGFTREGTLRNACAPKGVVQDLAVFGITREDVCGR
jgi:RimJ/RimL family protein N-acetyltransferase